MDLILDFLKKYQKTVILFAVFLVLLIIGLSVASGQRSQVADARSQVSGLESELKLRKEKKEENIQDTETASGGVNTERISSDTETMESFFQTAFTFDSLDAYQEVREQLKDTYDLADTDAFLKVFYPFVLNGSEESYEDRYGYVPAESGNYQVSYVDSTSYLGRISSDEYTYVSLVTLDSNGTEYSVGVTMTINGDGLITDISAAPVLAE